MHSTQTTNRQSSSSATSVAMMEPSPALQRGQTQQRSLVKPSIPDPTANESVQDLDHGMENGFDLDIQRRSMQIRLRPPSAG